MARGRPPGRLHHRRTHRPPEEPGRHAAPAEGRPIGMFKNIGSNWLLMVVTVAATYILLPYSLKHIGQEQYGIWLIITSLTGYMGLLMLGVPMASVRFMADSLAKHDYEQMNKFIGSSAGLFLFAGVVSLVVGCGVFVFFESAFPIPPELRNPVRAAFFLVLFYIAGGFSASFRTVSWPRTMTSSFATRSRPSPSSIDCLRPSCC